MTEKTTVQVSKETKGLLREIGAKGESYEEIILELIELREAFVSDLKQLWDEAREKRDELVTLEEYAEHHGL